MDGDLKANVHEDVHDNNNTRSVELIKESNVANVNNNNTSMSRPFSDVAKKGAVNCSAANSNANKTPSSQAAPCAKSASKPANQSPVNSVSTESNSVGSPAQLAPGSSNSAKNLAFAEVAKKGTGSPVSLSNMPPLPSSSATSEELPNQPDRSSDVSTSTPVSSVNQAPPASSVRSGPVAHKPKVTASHSQLVSSSMDMERSKKEWPTLMESTKPKPQSADITPNSRQGSTSGDQTQTESSSKSNDKSKLSQSSANVPGKENIGSINKCDIDESNHMPKGSASSDCGQSNGSIDSSIPGKKKFTKKSWKPLEIPPPSPKRYTERRTGKKSWNHDGEPVHHGNVSNGRNKRDENGDDHGVSNRGKGYSSKRSGRSRGRGSYRGRNTTGLVWVANLDIPGSTIVNGDHLLSDSGDGVEVAKSSPIIVTPIPVPVYVPYPYSPVGFVTTQPFDTQEAIRRQIEYYFSEANLQKDIYMRRKMDDDGYVPLSVIATFHRLQSITQDLKLIIEALDSSSDVELSEDKIKARAKTNPTKWPIGEDGSRTPTQLGLKDDEDRDSESKKSPSPVAAAKMNGTRSDSPNDFNNCNGKEHVEVA
ncbi:La-related protein 1 [Halotydeus destructor]|nr:La-related protein 1 [Halotydeus destructor]